MKKIYYLFLGAMLLVSTTACQDKLDIEEHGALTADNYFKTDEEIETVEDAMYSQLLSQEYTFLCLNLMSDDFWAGGGVRGDNPILERMNEFTFDAENDYINSVFTGMYTLNYKANVVLESISEENTSTVAKRARAEAKFFIGYAYFYLTALWGTPPLVDHCLNSDEYWQPNGNKEELWAYAEKNLTEAINSGALAEKKDVNDTTWRITKQTAQAVLGKVYLWQGKTEKAAEQFEAVVNSGKYKLFDAQDFGEINRIANEHNCESMLEMNRGNDTNNASLSFTMTFCTAHWRTDKMTSSTIAAQGISTMGWGFFQPQKSLYDAFVARDGANTYRRNQTLRSIDELHQLDIHINEGQEIPNEGYFMWKWRPMLDEWVNSPFYNSRNIRYMRYAEVLLLDAECQLQLGADGQKKATEYVNQIRRRAQLPDLNGVTLDDVKIEKRLELCGEHTRYMDLIRWGDAATVLKDQGAYMPYCNDKGEVRKVVFNNDASMYGFKTGKHELLPFPAAEIRTNPNITQNPGY